MTELPQGTPTTSADTKRTAATPSYLHERGPSFAPTHALAAGPVSSPPHTVDGFVKEVLAQ